MLSDFLDAPSPLWSLAAKHVNGAPRQKPFAKNDVVVVGSGATGLVTTLAAAEQGGDVSLLEAASEPGGIFKHNGGIVLDGFEGDVRRISQRYKNEIAAKLLKISHDGISSVREVAAYVGAAFKKTGYVTVFRNRMQKEDFLKRQEKLFELASTIYRPQQFTHLNAWQIVGGSAYEYGGIHSPHGGMLDSAGLIAGLMDKLKSYPNVRICLDTNVTGLEAAAEHGVRLYFKNGQMGDLYAKRAVLTGESGTLLPDFPLGQHVTTGMVAISGLPEKMAALADYLRFGRVPYQGSETIAPDYYRFANAGDKLVFLFGGSGRVGLNEEPFVLADVLDGLYRLAPKLKQAIARGRSDAEVLENLATLNASKYRPSSEGHPEIIGAWARRQSFSAHDLPVVKAYDPASASYIKMADLNKEKSAGNRPLPHIPVLYVGELGGHGITFACDFGLRAGRHTREDYEVFETLECASPTHPADKNILQRRVANERKEHARLPDHRGRDWEAGGPHAPALR